MTWKRKMSTQTDKTVKKITEPMKGCPSCAESYLLLPHQDHHHLLRQSPCMGTFHMTEKTSDVRVTRR